MDSKSVPANQDYLYAMKMYREGKFNRALESFTFALDFYLYKMMYSLENCKHVQEMRLSCYQKLREQNVAR
jgi:hypothetical protein